ncbi:DUF951 domain-containing protein [Clostridium bornimense]|uniref:DUF951 domain-containing protein n=1 Tax=Clostridium bornimense TaxID=1216932 RepID=UPI001C111736|nr:DUF951 domain-containing protein [Clostridium bornimense]MBU5315648.1 DUF951 domain-containing protein [Clostridium bornimense]
MNFVFNLGDIVEMKKGHPCGANEWEIIRLGADIKIKCKNCGRLVMISRSDFNKRVKKVIFSNEDNN